MPQDPRRLPVFLLTLSLVGAALYLVGVATDGWLLCMLTKPLPMVGLLVWMARDAPADRLRSVGLLGLGLGLTGDMLLEMGDQTFIPGLVAFLLGHLAYVFAFSKAAGRLAPLQALPMLAFGAAVALVVAPHLGPLLLPVVVYMVAICAMAWRAAAFAEARGGWAWAAPVGALLFLLSDSLIALNRFVAPIDGVRPAIILTYWAGQAGIAAGLIRGR